MPVSMKDIADAAGVTESTVSRALADSARVTPRTRARIQRLAEEMGYVPSAIAQALATRRTHTIGVVVSNIADPFAGQLVSYLDREALRLGYSIILSTCGADPQREAKAINLLLQKRVDAIIVPDTLVAQESLAQLQRIGVPVVLLGRRSYPYSVGTDNEAAARLAVEHLLDLGHVRIGYIGRLRVSEESLERRAGYERALEGRGIRPDPAWVVDADELQPEGGRRAVEELLRLPEPPTAVFCFDDWTASGALIAAYDAGLTVPRDLSVMGFDDSTIAAHLIPPLTTVAQEKIELARLALEMAVGLLQGGVEPADGAVLPARLVVRRSTARPPGGSAPKPTTGDTSPDHERSITPCRDQEWKSLETKRSRKSSSC